MNKLNSIIINNEFENDKLYLLLKPNNDFGFFYQNHIVYFGKKSVPNTEQESITTSYLDLNLNIYVESLSLDSSFETGKYDLLAYKGDLDNEMYFDIFYNICNAYCFDSKGISFYEFFNSLVDIFRKEKEQNFKNLVGLLGELFVIKKVYEDYHHSLANNWHLTGSNSRFDFSFKKCNLEIKATSKSESVFLLKHSQIFNNQNNFVGVCSLIETGEGESIESLFQYFKSIPEFSQNVKFQLALNDEIMKVNNLSDRRKSFVLDSFKIYSNKNMETLVDIPPMISKIEYEYDFSDIEESSFDEIIRLDE